MMSDECCGSCRWWGEDRFNLLCGNQKSMEYLEEHRWSDACDGWEAKDDRVPENDN